jgi:hypothetical protein
MKDLKRKVRHHLQVSPSRVQARVPQPILSAAHIDQATSKATLPVVLVYLIDGIHEFNAPPPHIRQLDSTDNNLAKE